MKIGAEDRNKLLVMVVLLVIAILASMRFFSSPSYPAAAATARAAATDRASLTLDPTLRKDLLKRSEETTYKGNGRNIFSAEAALPDLEKPKLPVVVEKHEPTGPQPPPPPPAPPPIPLKFYGFANRPGQPKSIFLSSGEDVFIAKEGDIVNRRYKVVKIGNNSVEMEDVVDNHHQQIPLTQG
jgi:hypothetical protein